ncbi:MAG: PAS domain S-box protein [Anaerolineae bacterium]|nr:PAS domain S-box protein [Anaerolineae bacterium]
MKFWPWPAGIKRFFQNGLAARKQTEQALRREHSLLAWIMETSPAGITIVNRAGQIIFANVQAEKVLGLTKTEITDRAYNAPEWRITDYQGRPFPDEKLPFRRVMATGQPVSNVRHAIEWPDGRRVLLSVNGAPLLDESDQVERVVFTIEDVTERAHAEQALQLQRDLALALSSTNELAEALRRLLEATFNIEGLDCGGVYLVNRHTGELDLIYHKGLPPQFVERVSHYKANSPQTRLIMAGKPVYRSYAEIVPITDEVRQGEGLRAMAVIPIRYEGQVMAALNLASHTHDEIPGRAREVLETVAIQVGGAIAHMQAEAALRESQANLQAFFDALDDFLIILDAEGRIVRVNPAFQARLGYSAEELVGASILTVHPAEQREAAVVIADMLAGKATVCAIPLLARDGTQIPVETKVTQGKWSGQDVLFGISRDVSERKESEEILRQRNRELAMLNQASRALSSSLNLDEVLANVLGEVQRLLNVLACSVWLIDPETNELVCRQVTEPQGQLVRGWRLAPGQGLGGWVVEHKESLNVPDVLAEVRHFKGVDQKTGLHLRSILTVPLLVKQKVLGVMQVVDERPHRFDETHETLLESLAATAAIAIQNAQWYEQARQDAETKLALFHEVNHRVKNNLTAIIGLLYAERRHAQETRPYEEIINALVNRVQGLATVHELLSAAEWRPLPLSDLATQIIHAAVHALSPVQTVSVDVSSSPIEVSPAQANHLALIINELATNSIKYALREQEKAKISVRIGEDENVIRFKFRDNGPGYPADVLQLERHNVGLYLIQTIVQGGLRGELSLHNEEGAVTLIQFKAA